MRRLPTVACAAASALALAGCGSGTTTVSVSSSPPETGTDATASTTSTSFTPASTPAPASSAQPGSATAIVTACGTLGARFRGIENVRGMRDPQPAAMHGRRVAGEMLAAGREAIAAEHEVEAELRVHGAPDTARSLQRAESAVKRLNRGLRLNVSNGTATGLRLQARFLRFTFSQLRAVCQRRGH